MDLKRRHSKCVLVTPKRSGNNFTKDKRYVGWSNDTTVWCVADSGKIQYIETDDSAYDIVNDYVQGAL